MTFRDYVAQRKAPYTAAGDALRILKSDVDVPNVTSADELRSYLEGRGASQPVLAAAETVWLDYKKGSRRGDGTSHLSFTGSL